MTEIGHLLEADVTEEYLEFIGKFKPKKNTDDCYTPPVVYNTVLRWALERYGFREEDVVRPFYPGGDYEHFHYPEGCVVLDNPPFSKMKEIGKFYVERGIKYFLFANHLTLFQISNDDTAISVNAAIVYENGAAIKTSFRTNMENREIICMNAPDLHQALREVTRKKKGDNTASVNNYPDNVLRPTDFDLMNRYGVQVEVMRRGTMPIWSMEQQRAVGAKMFGGGLIMSTRETEKVMAAKAEAESRKKVSENNWAFTETEKNWIRMMDEEQENGG